MRARTVTLRESLSAVLADSSVLTSRASGAVSALSAIDTARVRLAVCLDAATAAEGWTSKRAHAANALDSK